MHLEIFLNLPRELGRDVFLDLDESQELANNLVLIVGEDEPLGLASLSRVVELDGGVADLVFLKQHGLLVEGEV